MKTVGEVLQEARIKKAVSFEKIEKETKIRKKYLKSLEENKFNQVGQATTVRGFIKNYGQYLNLNPVSLLAIFRRDFTEDELGQVVLRGLAKPLDETKFSWNPQKTTIAIILIVSLLFLIFLGWHFFNWRTS